MWCALDKRYFSTPYLENIGVIMVCFNLYQYIDISHVLTSCLCILIMLNAGTTHMHILPCATYAMRCNHVHALSHIHMDDTAKIWLYTCA